MGITVGIVVSWIALWLKKRKKDMTPKKAIFNDVRSNLEQIQREQTKKKIDNITLFIAALDKEALKRNLELTEKLMNAVPESILRAEKKVTKRVCPYFSQPFFHLHVLLFKVI